MIYLIMGRTGEYADQHEWNVGYFKDEDKANEFKNMPNNKLKELKVHMRDNVDWNTYIESDEIHEIMKSYDSNFSLDYTGTCYEIQEVKEL